MGHNMEPGTLVGVTTAVVAIAYGLVEIVKQLIVYIIKRKWGWEDSRSVSVLTLDQKQKLTEIHAMSCKTYDIISKTDKDSVPLCYFPRSHTEIYKVIADLQYKVIERLAEITAEQRRIADLLDRIERRLDAK